MDGKKQVVIRFLIIITWIICSSVSLGSFLAQIDIGFLLGFVVWVVFFGGIIYFILWFIKELFGVTILGLLNTSDKQIAALLIVILLHR